MARTDFTAFKRQTTQADEAMIASEESNLQKEGYNAPLIVCRNQVDAGLAVASAFALSATQLKDRFKIVSAPGGTLRFCIVATRNGDDATLIRKTIDKMRDTLLAEAVPPEAKVG